MAGESIDGLVESLQGAFREKEGLKALLELLLREANGAGGGGPPGGRAV